jgi:hypothetical protein
MCPTRSVHSQQRLPSLLLALQQDRLGKLTAAAPQQALLTQLLSSTQLPEVTAHKRLSAISIQLAKCLRVQHQHCRKLAPC